MNNLENTLISSKRDITYAWDAVIDAIREMEDDYEQQISDLRDEIVNLEQQNK